MRIESQSQAQNPISQIDHQIGSVLEGTADQMLSPSEQFFSWMKRTIGHITIEPPRHFENEIPTVFQLPQWIFMKHKGYLKNTSDWSERVESWAVWLTKWIFVPLTFSRIGEAIQRIIAEKIIGRLVFAVTFCTLQIFHPVPYILLSQVLVAGAYLYTTSPVAFVTCVAGVILVTQNYFLALLWGETVAANKTLDTANKTLYEGLTDVQSFVSWAKVALGGFGAYGAYYLIQQISEKGLSEIYTWGKVGLALVGTYYAAQQVMKLGRYVLANKTTSPARP